MSTTPDLPPPAFRLIWRDGQYRVSAPNIGDTDCYTAELARTHADNCIRALTEDVGKTQEALRSALGEIAELKASCVREPPSVDRGPWSADPENDYVTSADFGWDVSLRVDGDFLSAEERRTYVAWLTDTLNAAALARAEKAEARAGSVPAWWNEPQSSDDQRHPVLYQLGCRLANLLNSSQWREVEPALYALADALAPSTPPNEATSRAQFEAAVAVLRDWRGQTHPGFFDRYDSDDYKIEWLECWWKVWQAARTQGDAA